MLAIASEPFYAPLNKPMIEQALAYQESEEQESRSALSNGLKRSDESYILLRERVQASRSQAFASVDEAIRMNQFTSDWMLSRLSVSPESLHRWREMALVVYEDRDAPDPDNGAAVITMRKLIPDRMRGWLPMPPKEAKKHNYFKKEPLWWAWRQDDPSSPVLPCPIPIPSDVPSHALVWTDWLGASWKPMWLRIGTSGCCRWAGTVQAGKNSYHWALTEAALEAWGFPIAESYKKALKQDLPLTRHHLASNALLLLATERLEEMHTTSFSHALLQK